jgi:MtfA peptidase
MIFVVGLSALLVVAWLLAQPYLATRRRTALRNAAFPARWDAILQERVPLYRSLPADLKIQLRQHIRVFLGEKSFIGCDGVAITDEMRVVIAAQACLLILNRRDNYFHNLREILVYPAAFIVDRVRAEPSGVLQEQRQVLSGESWSRGQVILSWEDVLAGTAVPDDGRNVVIHEFAHQLDQESGRANGAPRMRSGQARWARVLGDEFEALQRRARAGQPSLLNDYGASDPAEFFAVASEVFFEQPQRLAAEHAALYRELSNFYRVNPLSW